MEILVLDLNTPHHSLILDTIMMLDHVQNILQTNYEVFHFNKLLCLELNESLSTYSDFLSLFLDFKEEPTIDILFLICFNSFLIAIVAEVMRVMSF